MTNKLIGIVMALCFGAVAQVNLTGTVTDAGGGSPLSGVLVALKTVGTSDTTDAQGKYQIIAARSTGEGRSSAKIIPGSRLVGNLLRLNISEPSLVTVELFDATGVKITTLFKDADLSGGTYDINLSAIGVAAGLYFIRVRQGNQSRIHHYLPMQTALQGNLTNNRIGEIRKGMAKRLAASTAIDTLAFSKTGYGSITIPILSYTGVIDTALVAIPSAPSISSITSGDGSVTVTWGAVNGATSYNLYYTTGTTVTISGTTLTGATSPKQVTSLTNGTQYAFAVSAVNAGGESGLSSIATATPNLNDSLDLDSLGQYDNPALSYNIGVLTKRMQGFWQHHRTMSVVFLGSSHTSYGINPNYFTANQVANMSIFGGPFSVAKFLTSNYLLTQCPSMRLVGCDLIPATMNWTNFFTPWPLIADNLGFNYDQNHGYWKTGLPDNFEKLVALAPCPDLPEVDTLGSDHSAVCSGWGGSSPDLSGGGTTWSLDDPQYPINLAILKGVAAQLYLKKVHFLVYITPESPYYKNTDSYGRYGPSWPTAEAIITQIKAWQDTFPGYFHFYDANLDGNHDYADSEASDCEHLCTVGAQKLSRRMDSVVTSILSQ